MEGLTRLVTESLVRHGFDRPVDYRRLQWSSWFRCDSPQSLLSVPSKPGVIAIAEEITPAETTRRMLAVTQFMEADDMALGLVRVFARPNPMRTNFESGRYFVRFVMIEDESQRHSAATALSQWMLSTSEKVTGIGSHFAGSLELTSATEFTPQVNNAQANLFSGDAQVATAASAVPRSEASGTPPFPSGF